ncbi:hypothetical protein [Maribacter arenosus]|uniref:Uncharacterized protein n=1 Tax=Maribacter arenosus TaxID=1854708 RepID=A0ABR7VGL4_9FLAO|nr:hypothetical protein [Maribacter arenosus]MBD0852076.1 hypothetical protein [Maribacter arenosus]
MAPNRTTENGIGFLFQFFIMHNKGIISSYILGIRTNILVLHDTQREFDFKSHFAGPILKIIGDTITKVSGVGAGISTSGTLAPARGTQSLK